MAQIAGQDTRLNSADMERWAILMRPSWRADLTTAVILTGSYLLLIAFFAYVDVYNLHFFDAGYSLSYNLLRVVFAAYLFWIVTFSGSSLLALISSNGAGTLSAAERDRARFLYRRVLVDAGDDAARLSRSLYPHDRRPDHDAAGGDVVAALPWRRAQARSMRYALGGSATA